MTDTDVFVYAPCTSPFVTAKTVSACINRFIDNLKTKGYDCVSTVSAVKNFLWKDGKALNYDPFHAPNSQDLPDIVALNFGTTVVGRGDLIKNRNIIGLKPDFVKISDIEAVDIDTLLDFKIAETLYREISVLEE